MCGLYYVLYGVGFFVVVFFVWKFMCLSLVVVFVYDDVDMVG